MNPRIKKAGIGCDRHATNSPRTRRRSQHFHVELRRRPLSSLSLRDSSHKTKKRTISRKKFNKHILDTTMMRITTLVLAVAFLLVALMTSSTVVHAEPLYQPTGAVFSNIDSVSKLPLPVVFDYLTDCAGVNALRNYLPENTDCLLNSFMDLEFPQGLGDVCSSPVIENFQIVATLEAASDLCPGDFAPYVIGTATSIFYTLFKSDLCWASLCEENSLLGIESLFVKQCSGVNLPYPIESRESMVFSGQDEDNTVLTCMLDHVMNAPASEFGFDEPPIQCWPPAYDEDNIGSFCSDSLAKPAFDHCTSNSAFFDTMKGELTYMSMSMSMSMDYGDTGTSINEMELIERFCTILDGITTEKSLECLGMICDNPSTMPSGSPSAAPSDAPSFMPSSNAPSFMPSSNAPSYMPSYSLSVAPSTSPSAAPSVIPTASPSGVPSVAPSMAPSSSPTFKDLQYIVDVKVIATMSMDLGSFSAPDLLDEVVKGSFLEALSNFGDSINVTVLAIDGNTLRRRLQNVVPIQFSVEETEECYHPDCNEYASNLIAILNNILQQSVTDGSMTTVIRQEAVARTVDELATATVITDSYELVQSESVLHDPVIVSNPEGVISGGGVLVASMTSIVVLVATLFVV